VVAQINELRNQLSAPPETRMPSVAPGFGTLQAFELMQRQAKLLASSTLVPTQYRLVTEKTDRYGNVTDRKENPNAISNCVIALNMATRMQADPLMVMQNLYLVEGRPSWSSQWIIAAINNCGRFSPLRFDIEDLGDKTVDYTYTRWENNQRVPVTEKVNIRDRKFVAWALEKGTDTRLESPPVTIEMAVREGWYTKNGSKWQTMPDVMGRYRCAAFFGKIYAPELLMGLPTAEETEDFTALERQADGSFEPAQAKQEASLDELRQPLKMGSETVDGIKEPGGRKDEVIIEPDPQVDEESPQAESRADGFGSAAQAELFAGVPQEEERPAPTGRTRGSRNLD
jgi:hypothetical protein